MNYSVNDIANAVLVSMKQRTIAVTPIQLMKLVYICFVSHSRFHDERLFRDKIEASAYGPVIPALQRATKGYGGDEIPLGRIPNADPLDRVTSLDIDKVVEVYKDYSAVQLSKLIQIPGGPWAQAFKPGKSNGEITFASVIEYYRKEHTVSATAAKEKKRKSAVVREV